MGKFRVVSGSLSVEVKATNHRTAAIKAIDEHGPRYLGIIIEVLDLESNSDDACLYMKSEFVLECMGYKVE